MKVSDKDIVSSARRLRDRSNASQPVHPWRHPSHRVMWPIVAIPAAAVIGFFLGLAIPLREAQAPAQVFTHTDTVYVHPMPKEGEMQPAKSESPAKRSVSHRHVEPEMEPEEVPEQGQPISSDNIRYDMVVTQ